MVMVLSPPPPFSEKERFRPSSIYAWEIKKRVWWRHQSYSTNEKTSADRILSPFFSISGNYLELFVREQYGDDFFNRATCERCGCSLTGHARTMSWFTEETICTSGNGKRNSCQFQEEKIKQAIKDRGEDTRDYEGCGYLPTISPAKDFIEGK